MISLWITDGNKLSIDYSTKKYYLLMKVENNDLASRSKIRFKFFQVVSSGHN